MEGSVRGQRCILFDWGDTLMRVFPGSRGPMVSWPRVEPVPHAAQVLADLHEGWTLALATNAPASDETHIRAAFDRVNLSQFLDKVYCFRAIGHRKPSPAFFQYVLNDLNLDSSQVVMVGDEFEADVIGAYQAGIRAIWFNERTEEDRKGALHCTIHDLRELAGALASMGCHAGA